MTAARKPLGPAHYFWSYEFRFDLRDATRAEQEAVRRAFKRADLKLDGFTKRHILVLEKALGRRAEARKSPHAPKTVSAVGKARVAQPCPEGVHPMVWAVAEGLNDYAGYMARDELVPNHSPSSPAFWFYGLARDQAAACRGSTFRSLLTPAARQALNAKPSWWGRAGVVKDARGRWRNPGAVAA